MKEIRTTVSIKDVLTLQQGRETKILAVLAVTLDMPGNHGMKYERPVGDNIRNLEQTPTFPSQYNQTNEFLTLCEEHIIND